MLSKGHENLGIRLVGWGGVAHRVEAWSVYIV